MNAFASLRAYRPEWLSGDLIAGLMLAAIAIPEQLATAKLAGFPPEVGLYAFAGGAIAFAIVGANRFLSVGADSTTAPIFAGAIGALAGAGSPQYHNLAGSLALMVGFLLLLAGVVRAGWIADLLSVPVTVGFLAGISVHIIVGQLPSLLGVPAPSGSLLERLFAIITNLQQTNPYALALGAAVLAATLIAERINDRIPGALIGLALAGTAVAAFDLRSHGVAVLGALKAGLPTLQVPHPHDVDQLIALAPLAFIIALVCMMQTSAVVRAFPSQAGQPEDVSTDFAGIGAACVASGIVGAFPVNSSPPRTAVIVESGGRSQLASLTALAIIAAIVIFFSRLAAFVPEAALAGVLIFIGMRIFRIEQMKQIARYSQREIELVALSAFLVIVLPIEQGMLLAIVLSLAHGIRLVMRPPATELYHVPGTTVWWPAGSDETARQVPGIVVFAPGSAINFTNAEYVREKLLQTVAAAPQPVRLVVLEASGVFDVDYTGSQSVQATVKELRDRGIDVAIARLIGPHAQEAAAKSGLLETIGEDHIFKTVQEAVDALGGAAAKT